MKGVPASLLPSPLSSGDGSSWLSQGLMGHQRPGSQHCLCQQSTPGRATTSPASVSPAEGVCSAGVHRQQESSPILRGPVPAPHPPGPGQVSLGWGQGCCMGTDQEQSPIWG